MEQKKRILRLLKVFGFILTVAVGSLFLIGNRYSQLAGYFVYMSAACTVVPLPTPPYVIAMGKVFHPSIVACAGALGNCIAAFAEYYFITWLFSRTEIRTKVQANKVFSMFSTLFEKAAFLCLIFTGFTPIPFEPFRLAAITAKYSVSKYLAAVFIGRFPRYYLIALLGYRYKIPTYYLIILLIILFIIPVLTSIKARSAGKEEIVV